MKQHMTKSATIFAHLASSTNQDQQVVYWKIAARQTLVAAIAGPLVSAVFATNALAEGGIVRCWGRNNEGQCNVPADLVDVIQISGGYAHTIALRAGGTVRCWGRSDMGQCDTPADLRDVVQVVGGGYNTIALRANGRVLGWGYNSYGQCNAPADLNNAVQVAAGVEHTVALRATGAITCWGNNNYSQCNVPTDLGEVVQVAAGSFTTIALKANGQVRCWGSIWDVPADLTDAVQVVGGGQGFTIARRSNRQVRCWGSNDFHACDTPADLTDVVQIAGGDVHTIALRANGRVLSWGASHWNGSGNFGQCNVPSDLIDAVQVAGGGHHTIALICVASAASPQSPELAPFSFGNNPSWTATGIERASNGATLKITARGLLGTSTRFLTVKADGVTLATNVFGSTSGATSCGADASTAIINILAAQFLQLTADGQLAVEIIPSINATSVGCASATLTAQLSYTLDPIDCDANGQRDECDILVDTNRLDCNHNGALDSCEIAANPSLDCDLNGRLDSCELTSGGFDENQNGRLDACELLYGDLNLDGRIDGADLGGLLSLWGISNPPYGDLNRDQIIGGADLGILLGRWGLVP